MSAQVRTPSRGGALEFRAAAACLGLIVLSFLPVLLFGRPDAQELGALLLSYARVAVVAFLVVTMFALVGGVLLLGLRSGFRASPLAHLTQGLKTIWADSRGFSLLWPFLVLVLLLTSYNSFKQSVLPLAGFRFDPLLAQIDRILFAGQDPGLWLLRLFDSATLSAWVDTLYHAWFLPMVIGVGVAALLRDPVLRARYLFSYVGVWVLLGQFFAFLLPAAGPCYYTALVGPDVGFEALMAQLQQHNALLAPEAQIHALRYQAGLLEALNAEGLQMGGGISAIPSVHNALAVLFAIGAWRLNRWIGAGLWAYAFLIWIGSFYLGWHYAIDGIAGGLGAVALWFASGWLFRAPARVSQAQAARGGSLGAKPGCVEPLA